MIEKFDAKLPGFTLTTSLVQRAAPDSGEGALEISLDQHYGIRIVVGKQWTKIQFREANTWSSLTDTRDLIREQLNRG